MGLDERLLLAARLLSSPEAQRRFFAPSADASEFGLGADEFRAMRRIDPRSLSISSEGFGSKRVERIEGRHPRAIRAILDRAPERLVAHLQGTAPARTADEEARAFRAFVSAHVWSTPDLGRWIRDLCALEGSLSPIRELAAVRISPGSRPRRAPDARAFETEGPLDVWPLDGGGPDAYPVAPRRLVAARVGATVRLWRLEGDAERLWTSCEEAAPVEALVARAPTSASKLLFEWLQAGLLEVA